MKTKKPHKWFEFYITKLPKKGDICESKNFDYNRVYMIFNKQLMLAVC